MRCSLCVRARISLGLAISFFISFCKVSPAAAAGADYDGNGFSEIPVLSADSQGGYVWTLFDPFSGTSTEFTRSFGGSADEIILANWIYAKVTSAGIISAPDARSGGRLVWKIRTTVRTPGGGRRSRAGPDRPTIKEQTKYLGRPGDIVITGGDFDGDKVADAVVIANRGTGKHKWGLRANFFLASYNPGLNVNRAYFDFGSRGADKPFFLNPDGASDWFALARSVGGGRQQITMTQPFTKEVRSFFASAVPDPSMLPVPIGQENGRDLLIFYGVRNGQTEIDVRNLSGAAVAAITIPVDGDVTVGNYGPGPGEEVAVSKAGEFFIFNPITKTLFSMRGPTGLAVDSVNINTVL